MKPIGPYVAARDVQPLADESGGGVRTVRATDRLTGMPALLHLLSHPVTLPDLPGTAPLLPFTDAGLDGTQAYLVTELPLAAQPARDPEPAARGALAALAALHARGQAHGGVSAAQLWAVDGEVLLAGAGLPWQDEPTPAGDLRDLARTLDALGGVPAPLRTLARQADRVSALDALRALNGEQPLPDLPPEIAGVHAPDPAPAHPQAAPVAAAPPEAEVIVIRAAPEVTPESPVAPVSPAPAPGKETPQERRRRENEERRAQAILDAQAGAKRKAERLRAQAEAQRAEADTTEIHPLRIGFGTGETDTPVAVIGGDDDLPDWTPELAQGDPGDGDVIAPRLTMRDVPRVPEHMRRAPLPPEPGPDGERPLEAGKLPGRHRQGDPIRIGWDEDGTWRVVREVPAPPPGPALPRWVWPLLALIALTLGVLWAARAFGTPAQAGAACCDVAFTVRGAQSAKAFVLRAPAGRGHYAGQALGQVPGTLHLNGEGAYTLKFTAAGRAPVTVELSAPLGRPVPVVLAR